jgi:flagellar motor switch protein FliN
MNRLQSSSVPAAAGHVATSATAPVQSVDLPALQTVVSKESAAPANRLAALAGVKATVSVRAGTATTTVGEVLGLKEGAVLALDTELNAPFDVMLNGTVIARGELVAVGDNFGVRLTQVQAADGR